MLNYSNTDDFEYIYDSKGNLTEVFENHELYCRYGYDKKSRIIREDNTLLKQTILYYYDKHGKLLERKYYDYTLSTPSKLLNTDVFHYRRNRLISFNDERIEYDKYGNPTIYRNEKFHWSKERNLLSIGDFFLFDYNDQNIRISKTIDEDTTQYYLCANKMYAQEDNYESLTFIYENDEPIGFSYKSDNQSIDFVYKKNKFGDIIGICDNNNNILCRYVYDAFGNHQILIRLDNQYIDISLSTNNNLTNLACINPFRYHGKYFDVETGLYYENGHYYDPNLGNYLN